MLYMECMGSSGKMVSKDIDGDGWLEVLVFAALSEVHEVHLGPVEEAAPLHVLFVCNLHLDIYPLAFLSDTEDIQPGQFVPFVEGDDLAVAELDVPDGIFAFSVENCVQEGNCDLLSLFAAEDEFEEDIV